MEQLAKNGEQGQQGSSGSQSDRSDSQQQRLSSQSGAQGQPGSQSSRQQARGQSANSWSGQSQDATDQPIEQALSRLRQAGDAMKRSGGPQQNSDATRRAADELHEATNLLAGSQQQLASNKLGSLTREAGRLSEQERAQADRIEKLAKADHQPDPNQTDLAEMMARRQELDRLAQDRQQLSDDLSSLQKNLRDTARETAPNEPGVAQKLRDALSEIDESDLDNHVQRTADWLRSGINPNSNGTESEIAQGLQKLSQQLQQAQQRMGKDKPGSGATAQSDETATLDQIERLRSQIEAMTSSREGNRGSGQNGQVSPAQNGQRSGQGIQRSGDLGVQSDEVRSAGGRGADRTAWNNIDTGNNRYGAPAQRSVSPDTPEYPDDTVQTYRQGMRDVSQLRHMIQGDAQTAKQIVELTRQMRQLDPSRFPGNPAIVEQMHRQLLSSVDRLELQLQRDGAPSVARTGKPYAVPAGYQDSVAEYYRRLSRNP
jgi:hypothetical protein